MDLGCRVEKDPEVSSDFNIRIDLGAGLTRPEKTILLMSPDPVK